MAFVKLIENQHLSAFQRRLLNHLAQQNALGDEFDSGLRAGNMIEANVVTDFASEFSPAFTSDTGGQAARLQDNSLAVLQEPVLEQNLRNLGGFARAGRR